MSSGNTDQYLAEITDEGLFERLATAVLRAENSTYGSLIHTGVNSNGKTVKSPVDGISFLPGAVPQHIIIVHHTITARHGLEKKWLHDPSAVKPRGQKSTTPAGDIIKTSELVAQERVRNQNLRATLVLTTNEEPSESLVRTVQTVGHNRGLEIDLWSRSRISDFLDNNPDGQWLRYSFLNIDQEQLSTDLFHELSKKNLEIYRPLDDQNAWIPRELDVKLTCALRRDVIFLVAGSGQGKSIACYKKLIEHVNNGGYGLILPHQILATSLTLEQAVMATLRSLHPSLADMGKPALSFGTPEHPVLLIVEDINRSGNPPFLVERLFSWSYSSINGNTRTSACWNIICPLWPEIFGTLKEQIRKRIEPLLIFSCGFTEKESSCAVLARARLRGIELSLLQAKEVSSALGHDPLLIALYDYRSKAHYFEVIEEFVNDTLLRIEADNKKYYASEYRSALQNLAWRILKSRQFELSWLDIINWPELNGEPLQLIRHLAHQKEILHIIGSSNDQRLSFRHDRVRDWLLADAVAERYKSNCLPDDILSDPFFAEVIGTVLIWIKDNLTLLQRIIFLNPLALFHALRLIGNATEPHHYSIIKAINDFLDDHSTHERDKLYLRCEALAMLSGTDSDEIPRIVSKFHDKNTNGLLAKIRNGDISGGIELCSHLEPGVGAKWRDIQIEHAKRYHGSTLIKALESFLRQPHLDNSGRIAALRLAGHFAEPSLALAIEACWNMDGNREDHLDEYLWAFAECCEDDPPRFLRPVCDAWASLSDQPSKDGWPSPRSSLAAYELRFAFHRCPPIAAIDYFIQRGLENDLKWPIIDMLHGMDHPKAVLFVVTELADIKKNLDGTQKISTFVMHARDDWRRAQDDGRQMSQTSRELLREIWAKETNDKYIRSQAFLIWSATQHPDDIEILRTAKSSTELDDYILKERLLRGDQQAIPSVVEKLADDRQGSWWQYGRYIWSQELTDTLDTFLARLATKSNRKWCDYIEPDWIISELIMRLPNNEAERILIKYWDFLQFSPGFIQTALYIATPPLTAAVQKSIAECPEPKKIFENLSFRYGIKVNRHPGVTRTDQIRTLIPYLHFLSPIDISSLWDLCNDKGWFTVRREIIDNYLQPPYSNRLWNLDSFFLELDKIVTGKRLVWLVFWIEEFLKTNISWDDIYLAMLNWLRERHSLNALQAVCLAVEHYGSRSDIGLLKPYEEMSGTESKHLINDVYFAVKRRSPY